jgi:hypothetical protein
MLERKEGIGKKVQKKDVLCVPGIYNTSNVISIFSKM